MRRSRGCGGGAVGRTLSTEVGHRVGIGRHLLEIPVMIVGAEDMQIHKEWRTIKYPLCKRKERDSWGLYLLIFANVSLASTKVK